MLNNSHYQSRIVFEIINSTEMIPTNIIIIMLLGKSYKHIKTRYIQTFWQNLQGQNGSRGLLKVLLSQLETL